MVWDEDMDYDDGPDEEWVDDEVEGEFEDDSGVELLYCPSCGAEVYEETQQCPGCGEWITPVYDLGSGHKPGWIIAVVVLLLVAFVAMFVL